MADLPNLLLAPHIPPFKIGRSKTAKHYGMIFTCLNTRAVHLELAVDLTTMEFTQMLRRFFSIRGYLVSFAAVFWDVTQRSPLRNGCSQPNNIPFHCLTNHSFCSISRTFSSQIRHFKLVQSEIMFYLPITWWDNRRQRRLVKRLSFSRIPDSKLRA